MLKIIFVTPSKKEIEVNAKEGLSVLENAHEIGLYGACAGALACTSCHVVVDPEWYKKLNAPSKEEENMLDSAFGIKETSRLCCQIIMTEDLNGLRILRYEC